MIICGSVAAGHGEHAAGGDLLIRSAVLSSSSTATGWAPNSADDFLAGVPRPHTART